MITFQVYAKSGSWLTSDYDQFHDLITDWCRIVVKGPLEVEQPLVDVYNTHGVFVNQRLLELCPNLSRFVLHSCLSSNIINNKIQQDYIIICIVDNSFVGNFFRCSNFPIKGVEEEEDDAVVIESVESEESYADEVMKVRRWVVYSFFRIKIITHI